MDQNPNTPPPNTPNQNQQPLLGFGQFSQSPRMGEFMTMLAQGGISPTIPNQPQFVYTTSPTIPFQNIQQNFNPQMFNQNFNDPRTFAQPQFQQPNFFGGTPSSAQNPLEETVPETQMQHSEELVEETQMPRREGKKKQMATTKKRGKPKPSLEIQG